MRAQSVRSSPSTSTTSDNARPEDSIESADTDRGRVEGGCRDLLEQLRIVVAPRKRRGIRHQLVSILAVAAAAVVAGARSYVAAAQSAAHAPAGVLAALEIRVDPRTGAFVVPCESTIRRTLQACDGDLLDKVLGAWLYPRLPTEQVTRRPPRKTPFRLWSVSTQPSDVDSTTAWRRDTIGSAISTLAALSRPMVTEAPDGTNQRRSPTPQFQRGWP